MQDDPVPFLSYTIRITPWLRKHKVLIEISEHRGGEVHTFSNGQFAPEEWTPEEMTAVLGNDVAELLTRVVEWMMWMDAERPS